MAWRSDAMAFEPETGSDAAAAAREFLLLRHAQAAAAAAGGGDFGRPLTAEGERQATRIGRLLERSGVHPDAFVSSPAARALRTARLAAAAFGVPPDAVVEEPRLYEAGPLALAEVVASAAAGHRCPLIVGHNPAFEDLTRHLGGLDRGQGFPPGAVARFRVTEEAGLRVGSGCEFVAMLRP
jgi:phosphohistidine phosphatase